MCLQKPCNPRIEAHDPKRSAIGCKSDGKSAHPAGHLSLDFDFEEKRHLSGNELEQALKAWNGLIPDAQLSHLLQRRMADVEGARAQPPSVGVVEHDDLIIGRQPDVALDTRAHFERRCKGSERVFGHVLPKMQSTVGKAAGTRIERVSS